MNRKHIIAILSLAVLHIVFVLSTLGALGDAFFIHRVLMLFQFLPLIAIINSHKLSENKCLLFLAFAMCISTLYLVDDFQTGFYGAAVNYESGIVPRMRTSAHLMAYQGAGKLVFLDYHAEYFLEFVVVHFLSEVAGIDYILIYLSAVRVVAIVMWSILFVWASSRIRRPHRQIWYVILASLILMASQGYNYEVSFAPILFLTFYMILVAKRYTYGLMTCALLVAVATMLASFRETLLIALIFLIALFMIPLSGRIKSPRFRLTSVPPSFVFVLFVMACGRVFQFSSNYYVESYINRLLELIYSIQMALKEEMMFREEPLITVWGIGNPLDRMIALVSVISAISLLSLLAIISIRVLLRKRNFSPLSFAVLAVYVLSLAVPVSSYMAGRIVGVGTIRDFSAWTILARSMAPLVVLTITPHFTIGGETSTRMRKLLIVFAMIYLSLTMIFAPFWFLRGEVKSSYDILRVPGDSNETVVASNGAINFITSRITSKATIAVSPESRFFKLYYLLPLKYRIGEDRVILEVKGAREIANVYDNGRYVITLYPYTYLLLAEIQPDSQAGK